MKRCAGVRMHEVELACGPRSRCPRCHGRKVKKGREGMGGEDRGGEGEGCSEFELLGLLP